MENLKKISILKTDSTNGNFISDRFGNIRIWSVCDYSRTDPKFYESNLKSQANMDISYNISNFSNLSEFHNLVLSHTSTKYVLFYTENWSRNWWHKKKKNKNSKCKNKSKKYGITFLTNQIWKFILCYIFIILVILLFCFYILYFIFTLNIIIF